MWPKENARGKPFYLLTFVGLVVEVGWLVFFWPVMIVDLQASLVGHHEVGGRCPRKRLDFECKVMEFYAKCSRYILVVLASS